MDPHSNPRPWQGRFRPAVSVDADPAAIRQLREGVEASTHGLLTLQYEPPILFTIVTPDGKRVWQTRGAHAVRAVVEVLEYLSWAAEREAAATPPPPPPPPRARR